jgi:hypothetical protein
LIFIDSLLLSHSRTLSRHYHDESRRENVTDELFDDTGELINFVSDDRARSESNGTFTPRRFSTPVRDYRDFGPVRLMSFGEARWLLPGGECAYGEFNLVEIAYNRER